VVLEFFEVILSGAEATAAGIGTYMEDEDAAAGSALPAGKAANAMPEFAEALAQARRGPVRTVVA